METTIKIYGVEFVADPEAQGGKLVLTNTKTGGQMEMSREEFEDRKTW